MSDKAKGTNVFRQDKYGRDDFDGKHNHVADGSDRLAEHQHFVLGFQHVASTQTVSFKAFITAFNESYSCDWATEEVYGRTDPIMLFKGNRRQIALNFRVPAYSTSEAYENLGRVQRLSQFLYPNYKGISSAGSKTAHAQTIAQSPLIRLKVMNLLANQNDAPDASTAARSQQNLSAGQMLQNYFNNGMTKSASSNGLLGAITSFQVNHNIENLDYGSIEHGAGTLLPKMMDITVQFQPIHEHTIGWNEMEPINPHWPYGVQLKTPGSKPAPSNSAPNATDDDLPEQARDNAIGDAAASSAWIRPNSSSTSTDLEQLNSGLAARVALVGEEQAEAEVRAMAAYLVDTGKINDALYEGVMQGLEENWWADSD